VIPQINIGSKLDGKGFKKAETALDKLGAKGKNTARNLGAAFSVTAILAFSKASIKAYAEDAKAAASLGKTLENLGLGFGGAAKEVNDYISGLERQTGVLDDELRPAMDRMLRATGSLSKSQELLSLALDISAGTGKSLTQVSQSLQKAYLGQTQAIGRLGVGLSKTELASSSMEVITARLTELFAGQAATAAEGLAGSMAKLTVASNNAKEALGADFITALNALNNGNGLPNTIKLIEGLASGVGDAVIGISRLGRNISILAAGNPLESIRDLQRATAADNLADMKETQKFGGRYAELYKKQLNASVKITKSAKSLTTETKKQLSNKGKSNVLDNKAIALAKANLALGKGEDVFDLDKIQNAAALASQAEQLGKATNAAQILGIANDTARLNVRRSMLELEDAIASGNVKQIELATGKLNRDVQILGALSGQEIKLRDIKTILESLKPKDLINLNNLNEALALLKKITDSPSTVKSPVTGSGSAANGSSGDFIAPISAVGTSMDAILEYADAATARANAMADLLDFQNAAALATLMKGALGSSVKSVSNPFGGQDRNMDTTINIYANTVSNPDELTNLIQDAVIRLNKRGDFTTTAGAL